jgi:hypothetical protein
MIKLILAKAFLGSAAAVAALGWSDTASAELSPMVYLNAAEKAPEMLRIAVTDTQEKTETDGLKVINVRAEVIDVIRSSSGLAVGDQVDIQYGVRRHPIGWVGPGQPPELQTGDVVPAFLTRDQDTALYRLAARGQSFSQRVWEKLVPHQSGR